MDSDLNALLSAHIEGDGPGAVLGVVADGSLQAVAVRGFANVEHQAPVERDSVFHIASTSKQFAAYSCALLADRGRLDLDAPVPTVLDWFPFREVTTRHLIHHVSGVRDQWALLLMSGRQLEDVITTEEIAALLARQQDLSFPPGTSNMYSNAGYTLLGLIVEAVTGLTLREFTAKEIFEPLGMTRTIFLDDFHEIISGRADSYARADDNTWRRRNLAYCTVGATSLNTTVPDLARWAVHAMSDADVRRLLETNYVLADGTPTGYGTGVMVSRRRGTLVVEHSGGDAGYRAHLAMLPEQGLAAICFSGAGDCPTGVLAHQALDLVLDQRGVPRDEEVAWSWEPAAGELAALDGLYLDPFSSETYDVEAEGTKLKAGSFEFEPLRPGVLAVRAFPELQLQVDPDVRLRMPAGAERRLTRVERWAPSQEELGACAGEFWSDELATRWTIAHEGDRLTLQQDRWGTLTLQPTVEGAFTFSVPTAVVGELTFDISFAPERNELFATMGRINRLRFRRVVI
jgi:CubicO group peptidase (beta-lactamase class C family)